MAAGKASGTLVWGFYGRRILNFEGMGDVITGDILIIMKTTSSYSHVLVLFGFLVGSASADLFVTNFSGATSGVASGVWRNDTSATNLAIPVTLTQSGGSIRPQDGSSTESKFDDSFPWQDFPGLGPIPPMDLFNPNFDGDFVNILVDGGATVTVTIAFNAEVTDPALLFTDVDTQTTLVFTDPFTISGSSGNMSKSGNTVTTNGTPVPLLDEETFGSLQFSGTFTELTFSIVNDGSDPVNDLDRTGFCLATESALVPVSASMPMLWVDVSSNNVTLDWGSAGALTEVQMLDDAWNWVPVPGADPVNQSSFVGSKLTLGPTRLFRGVYTP